MLTLNRVGRSDVWSLRANELMSLLNGPYHKTALLWLLLLTIGHWVEHLFQAVEVFVLDWPRPQALGALGLLWPNLVTSEWLHYVIALVMLVALVVLRPAFHGEARFWWNVVLAIQIWHHAEHALLLSQALTGHYVFGAAVPTSILQLFFPRIELHLFYNALATGPMVGGMLEHRQTAPGLRRRLTCTCATA